MLNIKTQGFLIALFFMHDILMANSTIKFGEISLEEIELTECSFEKDAPAVYLNYNGEIKLQRSRVFIKKHIRIKILKDRGIDRADISIPFYVKGGYERIVGIKAQTININKKGTPIISEVSSKEIYTININADWKEVRLAFPNVKTGSILEFEYTISSNNLLYLDDWDFQHDLPTIHSELKVEIPKTLDYKVMLQGNRLLKKYRDAETNFWELDNVPSDREEPYLFNKGDYVEKLRFQLAGYHQRQHYGLYVYKTLMKTWEDLAGEVLNSHAFWSYINKTSVAKEELDKVGIKGKNEAEKLRLIYEHVNRKFNWNGNYRRYTYQKFNDFYAWKNGYSSEVNLFLTLLLVEAGIEAYPVMVSTRSNGNYLKDHPFLSQFNHLVVQAIVDDRQVVLDATDSFRPYFLPDVECLGVEGFVLNKRNPKWWDIPLPRPSKASFQINVVFDNEDVPRANFSIGYDNYFALEHRKRIFQHGKEEWIDRAFDSFHFTADDKLQIKGLHDINEDLYVSGSIKMEKELMQFFKNEIRLKPFLPVDWKENPFKSTTRNYPVQFSFRQKMDYTIKIRIPKNCQLVFIPQSERINMPNGAGSFSYVADLEDDMLSIAIDFSIDVLELPTSQYDNIRRFYSLVSSKLNSDIVIKINN